MGPDGCGEPSKTVEGLSRRRFCPHSLCHAIVAAAAMALVQLWHAVVVVSGGLDGPEWIMHLPRGWRGAKALANS